MSTSAALDLIARQYGRRSATYDRAVRLAAYGRRSAILSLALSELVLAA